MVGHRLWMRQKTLFTSQILLLSFVVISSCVMGRESDESPQVKVGNLAVSGTTQPGTASGFGQNIVDKHSALAIFYPFITLGKHQNFTQIIPELIYGIRDDLSILLAFPTAVKFKYDGYHSSGSLDTLIQLEYAPYLKEMHTYTNQVSFVGSVFLPTGNEYKLPPTGYGSPSFFVGFVVAHLATEWYLYTSHGGLITTKNDRGIKPGNQFIYQAGVGRNIAYAPDQWTMMWMIEMNGTYQKKTRIDGIIYNNSGSNTITVGTALWFSTNRFVLEIEALPFVYQHFSSHQLKSSCSLSLYTGCRFN